MQKWYIIIQSEKLFSFLIKAYIRPTVCRKADATEITTNPNTDQQSQLQSFAVIGLRD